MIRTFPLRTLLWSSFIIALPAFGQRPCRSGIGLKIGAQYGSLHAEQTSYGAAPGAVAGVYVPLWCGHRFEMQPELLCSMQGTSFTSHEGGTHSITMFYAQLPLSVKFFFSNALNLQMGGQIGKLIAARSDGANTTSTYRPIDLGINMGLGVDLLHGVDFTLRYYYGMSAVQSDAARNFFAMNRTTQFTIGYRIATIRHKRKRH